MFLANGTFWQVGLMSEEGAQMHNAEVPDSAASSLPTQRRWGRRIPVPIQPCLALGTTSINNNNKKKSSQHGVWCKAGAGDWSQFRTTPQGMGQIVHCLVSLDGLSGKDVGAKQKLPSCLRCWFLQCNSGWQCAGTCTGHLMILFWTSTWWIYKACIAVAARCNFRNVNE